jgi:hypothetical protein
MKLFSFLALFIILFFSCSSDDVFLEKQEVIPDIEVVKVKSKTKSGSSEQDYETLIKFRNEEVLERTKEKLSEMTMEEKKNWYANLENFTSMSQLYEQALEEAESYYDREGGYEEFKVKYAFLYFPENAEDYGAYIPYKNEQTADLINENGNMMVGDVIITEDKISSYNELLESGRAYIEEEPNEVYDPSDFDKIFPEDLANVKSAPTGKFYAYNMVPGAWFFEKLIIGGDRYRHSTGWRRYGDRKIKINFERITKTSYNVLVLPGGFKLQWHIEVSFRKKGFLGGWYNYSSRSTTKIKIDYFNDYNIYDNYTHNGNFEHSGSSSHDSYMSARVIRHIKPQNQDWNNLYGGESRDNGKDVVIPFVRCVYEMPAYWADLTLTHRGISDPLRFAFTAPKLYGYTRYVSDKLE